MLYQKKIYCDALTVLQSMPSESIDLMYMEPPALTLLDSTIGAILIETKRVLKATGSVFAYSNIQNKSQVKKALDAVFGNECFHNVITPIYVTDLTTDSSPPKADGSGCFWYSKSPTDYQCYLNERGRLPEIPAWSCDDPQRQIRTPIDAMLYYITYIHSQPGDTLMCLFDIDSSLCDAAIALRRNCILTDTLPASGY